ncbi:Gef1p ASCRUDRAFT_27686, partial [Ascoidea rubescens DSM 1968]
NLSETKNFNNFKTIDWLNDEIHQSSLNNHTATANNSNIISDVDNLSNNNARVINWWVNFKHSSKNWFILTVIGMIIGIIAASLNLITNFLNDLKFGYCSNHFYLNKSFCCWGESEISCSNWVSYSNPEHYSVLNAISSFLIYLVFSLLFGLIASILVKYIAPFAAGSGISEVKCIVAGFNMNQFLNFKTFLIKSITLPLAIASGLSIGKEGPTVHYAACVGNFVSKFINSDNSNNNFINFNDLKEYITAATAAGVAVAFGAPIGGVLFSLEEISSIFQISTMWKSYFCALIATGILSLINPFRTGQLVLFEIKYNENWKFFEVPIFILLGVFGGIYGLVISKFNKKFIKFRQTYLKNLEIQEILFLILITSTICYFNQFLKKDLTETIEVLFQQCSNDSDSKETDEWSHFVCNFPNLKKFEKFKITSSLFLAIIFRMVLIIISYGCKIPCGIFIPSMAVGATFGRFIGNIIEEIYSNYPNLKIFNNCLPDEKCIIPGTYAYIGAGATLSGITNLTLTCVIIMFELTGALRYIIPTMISIGITRTIIDKYGNGGIADQMIKFNGLPFIDPKEEHNFHNLEVYKIFNNNLGPNETVKGMKLKEINKILKKFDFKTFPIIEIKIDSASKEKIPNDNFNTELLSLNAECVFNNHIPDNSIGIYNNENREVIDFSNKVNFSNITIDIVTSLESLCEIFYKIGPRMIFLIDKGKFISLLTRKDILRIEY